MGSTENSAVWIPTLFPGGKGILVGSFGFFAYNQEISARFLKLSFASDFLSRKKTHCILFTPGWGIHQQIHADSPKRFSDVRLVF